jgi:crossover junction endodeoxyribonuclease RusA
MSVWTLVIPQPDVWINANHRLHWAVKARRTLAWRGAACLLARHAHLPHLDRARIECSLRFTDARKRDVGNLHPTAKAIVDGLVDYGLLPDDDDSHLIGPDMRRGPKSRDAFGLVVVTITELPPEVPHA